MAYSGRYSVKNTGKYEGDVSKVFFRSLWERQVFRFLDENPSVVRWNSEETVIPYICKTDGKPHRYFMDIKFTTNNGKTYLVEIKPKAQTVEPKVKKTKNRRYINEVMTYVKNHSKWETAKVYAAERGWTFQIWTEETLAGMGIKLLTR
jgi:hypothetical protein